MLNQGQPGHLKINTDIGEWIYLSKCLSWNICLNNTFSIFITQVTLSNGLLTEVANF